MARFNLQDYETVDQRIRRFYRDNPEARIATYLIEKEGPVGGTRWIVRAEVYRGANDDFPVGTGFAFEVDGAGMANQSSALENCETSAIGRALANANYSGDKRASREEMEKVQREEQRATKRKNLEDGIKAAESVDGLRTLWSEANQWGLVDELGQMIATRRKELEGDPGE